jgi:Ca2+-binding RTX toxin-like protein
MATRLDVAGSAGADMFQVEADGGNAILRRQPGNSVVDLAGVDVLHLETFAGPDSVEVGDLAGTGLDRVEIELKAIPGAVTGDGEEDVISIDGAPGSDHVTITAKGTLIAVAGLPATVTLSHTDPGLDRLTVNGFNGSDFLDASAVALVAGAAPVVLTLDGGGGNDILHGSAGADLLIGGNGNDRVTGNRGNDTAMLGAGDDVFRWLPGDGSDTVDGGAGTDTLDFVGAAAGETVDISLSGAHTLFLRDPADVSMDLVSVERIEFAALGGVDDVTIQNLFGGDVRQIRIDFAAVLGGSEGDGVTDSVTVQATPGLDRILVTQEGSAVSVSGLQYKTFVDHVDAQDRIVVLGGEGNDQIESRVAGSATVEIDGGGGNDRITGGAGDDVLTGGDEADRFVFRGSNGSDSVTDFGFETDLLQISGYGPQLDSFADLAGAIAQVGADVQIDLGAVVAQAGIITLLDRDADALDAGDFVFV